MEKEIIMGKYWTKSRLKISRANGKSCDPMSEIRGLRWPSPSGVAVCDIPLFLGLVPLPVQSSLCLMAMAEPTSWDLQYNP